MSTTLWREQRSTDAIGVCVCEGGGRGRSTWMRPPSVRHRSTASRHSSVRERITPLYELDVVGSVALPQSGQRRDTTRESQANRESELDLLYVV